MPPKSAVASKPSKSSVPGDVKDFASLKLKTMGIAMDAMNAEQKKYVESWQEGT